MQSNVSGGMRVVFAGGGTGGHLFPGIAIAQEFIRRESDTQVLFIGAGKSIETSVLAKHGFPHKRISVEGIKGRTWWQIVRAVSKLPPGFLKSVYMLWRFHPHLVVGLGGYSAAPVITAAWIMRCKIVLQEQNILPGITNRVLAPLANRIYVSFITTETNFNKDKVRFVGNPIRKELVQCDRKERSMDSGGSGKKTFTILVLGGSQGAHRINMAVLEALGHLGDKNRFHFIHQTGSADEKIVTDSYRQQGISFVVQAFFNDMASLLKKADLVICRAGATTVAEMTAVGLATILIPFPFAADNHQVLNARHLENTGAAEVILEKELSGHLLAERIDYYAVNPDALRQMAENAKRHGKPEAAEAIVEDCYQLIRGDR